MSAFLILFQIITYIGIGFAVRRTKLVSGTFRADLSRFILYVSLPAFLLHNMNFSFSKELMNASLDMVLLSLLCYAIVLGLSSLFGKTRLVPAHEMAPYRYTMSFSNTGFLGYPIIAALLGQEAVFLAAMFNLTFDLLQWTYGVRIFEKGSAFKFRHLLNPAIIAILSGFVMFVLGLRFPQLIQDLIASLGGTATPLSMVTTGLIIAEFDLKDLIKGVKPLFVSFYRLIFLPLLICLVLYLAGLRGLKLAVPVLLFGMPAAASGPIIALNYGGDFQMTSRLLCITTILSALTIPLIEAVVKRLM